MSDKKANRDVSPSKEEEKKQYELRKKRQRRKETITVLAILSSVFIIAILLGLLKGGARMMQDITGGSMAQAREAYENAKTTLIGMGIISTIIMIVFLIQTIKDRKNRKRKRMDKNAYIDYDRLEMARIRVEKARMEAKKNKDKAPRIADKNIRISAMEQEYEEYFSRYKSQLHEGMNDEEYRKSRQEEYERYMSMDFGKDEKDRWLDEMYEDELFDESDEQSVWGLLKSFIAEHALLLGIATGVIILAVLGFIFI